jgi:hypothetical protein
LGRPVAIDAHPKHAVALGAARMALAGAAVEESAVNPTPGDQSSSGGSVNDDSANSPGGQARSKRGLLVGGAVAALLLVGGGSLLLLGGDDDTTSTTAPNPTSASTASTSPDSTEPATTVAPCDVSTGRCSAIDSIAIEGDHYVATYRTDGFEPLQRENGGSDTDHHVHFFFNTFQIDQVGSNVPEERRGVWTVWDLPSGGGEFRFDQAKVADRGSATHLCVGVADANHGISTEGGDCIELPA